MTLKTILVTSVLSLAVFSCGKRVCVPGGHFSKTDIDLIMEKPDSVPMRILTIFNQDDYYILRSSSSFLLPEEINGDTYNSLKERMLVTVKHPQKGGVGLAGPQVGIRSRIVAVQRFDKEGEPFEVYPNIVIDSLYGNKVTGREGCLSIPGMHGNVERFDSVKISYTGANLEKVEEKIGGFTAIIFQHECDHLRGALYTDYITFE